MVSGLNFMYNGFQVSPHLASCHQGPPLTAQLEVLSLLHMHADDLLQDSVHTKAESWMEEISAKRMGYDGVSVAKAIDLTLAHMIPGLPPGGIARSVEALPLCAVSMKEKFTDPSLSICTRSEWPDKLSTARVTVSKAEWEKISRDL